MNCVKSRLIQFIFFFIFLPSVFSNFESGRLLGTTCSVVARYFCQSHVLRHRPDVIHVPFDHISPTIIFASLFPPSNKLALTLLSSLHRSLSSHYMFIPTQYCFPNLLRYFSRRRIQVPCATIQELVNIEQPVQHVQHNT